MQLPVLRIFAVSVAALFTIPALGATRKDRIPIDLGPKGLKYKVMSASTAEKPLDRFKVVLQGIDLAVGDRLSVNFNGYWIGNLANDDGLTLDEKLRAKGQLGSYPYVWHKCKARYIAKRRMLVFMASRGKSDSGGAPMVMAQSGISPTVWVTVVVDRAPADGVPDILLEHLSPGRSLG